MDLKQNFPWLPAVGAGLRLAGIGVIIIAISRIVPAFFIFLMPGPAGAGPFSTTLMLLEAVGGVGVLVVGWGLIRIGNELRRRG